MEFSKKYLYGVIIIIACILGIFWAIHTNIKNKELQKREVRNYLTENDLQVYNRAQNDVY